MVLIKWEEHFETESVNCDLFLKSKHGPMYLSINKPPAIKSAHLKINVIDIHTYWKFIMVLCIYVLPNIDDALRIL